MNMNKNLQIIHEDGKAEDVTILLTVDNKETGKSYMVYTDNTLNEDGELMKYLVEYDKLHLEKGLLPVPPDHEMFKKINELVVSIEMEKIERECQKNIDNSEDEELTGFEFKRIE